MSFFWDSNDFSARASWLCRIRWFAIAGVIITTTLAWKLAKLDINVMALYIIALVLVVGNVSYLLFIRTTRNLSHKTKIKRIRRNINFQISSDFIILTLLLHFSGGIENPFVVFYVFHMIISTILLPKSHSYPQFLFSITLFLSMAISEYMGWIPHHSINKHITQMFFLDKFYLFISLGIFVITAFIVVYITSSLATKIHRIRAWLLQANKDLMENDIIKNEYMQRVTHDIKGHLAAILINLTIVERQVIAPIDQKNMEFIAVSIKRTDKLAQFVNELLSLTNMRLNKESDMQVFHFLEVLNNALHTITPLSEGKNINLTHDFNFTDDNFYGIRFSVEEFITNLLQNAVKYTPKEGSILLKASSDGNNVFVQVSDTGYGIPDNELPHIFEEFYRASNAKAIERDGTGVGLSLVKAIVERHQGTIEVASQLNKGTTFTVKLPILPKEKSKKPQKNQFS